MHKVSSRVALAMFATSQLEKEMLESQIQSIFIELHVTVFLFPLPLCQLVVFCLLYLRAALMLILCT